MSVISRANFFDSNTLYYQDHMFEDSKTMNNEQVFISKLSKLCNKQENTIKSKLTKIWSIKPGRSFASRSCWMIFSELLHPRTMGTFLGTKLLIKNGVLH